MLTRTTIVSQLRKWGSCDIADSLIRLKHADGGFLGTSLTMYSPQFQAGSTKIVGPVYTVKLVPKDDVTSPRLSGHYMDAVPKDAVVFISQPTPHINAVFGGLMALRARQLNATGTVVDGNLRDLEEHRHLEFPVFAKGVSTSAGGPLYRASEVNVPVKLNSTVQERWIHPGDYIIADLNGVVCVPEASVADVIDVVSKIVEADEKCAEAIKGGRSVAETFKEIRGQ